MRGHAPCHLHAIEFIAGHACSDVVQWICTPQLRIIILTEESKNGDTKEIFEGIQIGCGEPGY